MLDRFLDSDKIVIKANKTSIIKFENNRFTVFLSFKENQPISLDNYHLSLNCFKKLKEWLDKTSHLLNQYDKIFDDYLKLGILEEAQTQGRHRPSCLLTT